MSEVAGSAREAGRLWRDAWDRAVWTGADGVDHIGVEVVRLFPVTDPDGAFSVLDAEGRELVHAARLPDLSGELGRAVRGEAERREFVPVILRIVNQPLQTEPSEWVVETDRGRARFLLESEDDLRENDRHEVAIVDRDGIRYRIPDARRLDAHSRRVLDRFL